MTNMTLHCPAFAQDAIAAQYAFGKADPVSHVVWGGNCNPALSWEQVPSTAQSLALVCCDPDAPSVPDHVNQAGHMLDEHMPRQPFYHWLLWDIPVSVCSIPEGALSQGVTARGKAAGMTAYGYQGVNDYTDWFARDGAMAGAYGGYDGPCPPWNDARVHRYVMTLYALDRPLGLSGEVRSAQLLSAMNGHILCESSVTGRYSLHIEHAAGA